jgi:hypothetical protein
VDFASKTPQLTFYGCVIYIRTKEEKLMDQHIRQKRLVQVADEQSRMSEAEFEHLENCSECQAAYGKSILQVARARAKEKCRPEGSRPK